MQEKLELLIRQAKRAADAMAAHSGTVRVVSHYDADGIASSAIIARALMRAGRRFRLTLVKQLTMNAIGALAGEDNEMLVLLDLGSGQLDAIRSMLKVPLVIVADHHQKEGETGGGLVHVNPMDYGISEDISGSGVAYIIARAFGAHNRDLSALAIVGAIGDSQIGAIGEEWGLFGLNREILKDAVDAGKIRVTKGLRLWGRTTRPVHKALEFTVDPYIPNVSGSESSAIQFLQELGIPPKKEDGGWRTLSDLTEDEQKRLASGIIAERVNGNHPNAEWIFGDVYELVDKGGECRDANEFATVLNACGKTGAGYLGVELCLDVERAFGEVRPVLEKYRKTVGDAVRWIHRQIEAPESAFARKTAKAWYILAGSRINENVISNALSIVEKSLAPGKPVFAFADSEEGVKVSARAGAGLVGSGINLKDVVFGAAEKAGGQGGGHSGAAGANIPAGSEEAFIAAAEGLLPGEDTNKSLGGDKNINQGEIRINSEAEADGRGSEKELKETAGREKVERKGLVQYFGSRMAGQGQGRGDAGD